jgi:hypothetical protein
MSDTPRFRPGDQVIPVHNDGPSMHDLVIADLAKRQKSLPAVRLLKARKELGLDRYKTILQANNGRDALLDLTDELGDAVVYARQMVEEAGSDTHRWHAAHQMYSAVLTVFIDAAELKYRRSASA